MPYPGVPKSKTAKLDRCVKGVMADSDFKKKYKNSDNKKSIAIGICRKAIKV